MARRRTAPSASRPSRRRTKLSSCRAASEPAPEPRRTLQTPCRKCSPLAQACHTSRRGATAQRLSRDAFACSSRTVACPRPQPTRLPSRFPYSPENGAVMLTVQFALACWRRGAAQLAAQGMLALMGACMHTLQSVAVAQRDCHVPAMQGVDAAQWRRCRR